MLRIMCHTESLKPFSDDRGTAIGVGGGDEGDPSAPQNLI